MTSEEERQKEQNRLDREQEARNRAEANKRRNRR